MSSCGSHYGKEEKWLPVVFLWFYAPAALAISGCLKLEEESAQVEEQSPRHQNGIDSSAPEYRMLTLAHYLTFTRGIILSQRLH